jgi:hypothetical protein
LLGAGRKTPDHGQKVAGEQRVGWGHTVTERVGCSLEMKKRQGVSSLKSKNLSITIAATTVAALKQFPCCCHPWNLQGLLFLEFCFSFTEYHH